MQQQHVVAPTLREKLFNLRLDDVRGFVTHDLHGEFADLRITEHPPERLGVHRRSQQVPQPLLLIFIDGDDQGLALTVHRAPSPDVCLPTNNSISRS